VGVRNRTRARCKATLVLVLTGLLAVAGVVPIAAEGKKKNKKVAKTVKASGPLSAGGTQTATANCPKKTHLTGGGYSVAPSFDPNEASGLRSFTSVSHPAGNGWTASSTAFDVPSGSGTLTSFARCERNRLGKIREVVQRMLDPPFLPGQGYKANVFCEKFPAIAGGYAGDGVADTSDPITGRRIVVVHSQRTGPAQWTVGSYNNRNASSSANVTAYVACEKPSKPFKRRKVSEVSSSQPIAAQSRTVAEATCGKKKHVVSGGFLVVGTTPSTSVPSVGIDESMPVGERGWRVGLYASPTDTPPPGSSLTTFAYCKKNK
jgi:hypothetical protein